MKTLTVGILAFISALAVGAVFAQQTPFVPSAELVANPGETVGFVVMKRDVIVPLNSSATFKPLISGTWLPFLGQMKEGYVVLAPCDNGTSMPALLPTVDKRGRMTVKFGRDEAMLDNVEGVVPKQGPLVLREENRYPLVRESAERLWVVFKRDASQQLVVQLDRKDADVLKQDAVSSESAHTNVLSEPTEPHKDAVVVRPNAQLRAAADVRQENLKRIKAELESPVKVQRLTELLTQASKYYHYSEYRQLLLQSLGPPSDSTRQDVGYETLRYMNLLGPEQLAKMLSATLKVLKKPEEFYYWKWNGRVVDPITQKTSDIHWFEMIDFYDMGTKFKVTLDCDSAGKCEIQLYRQPGR